ncbi:TPA: type I toxin-antitoxin system Ibs family toxin [Escherichia coli]|nr:type I toxin-antitoxin system Ibs family toxin [Escherichia coli]HBB3428612.1 type I toxin-antitoxin system Ibs family toxin [Escherichia coli]
MKILIIVVLLVISYPAY